MADLATRWPDEVGFNAVNFQINTPTQISETFSGKIRRVGLGVSYYSWEVQYPNLTAIDAGTVMGYVSQTLGQQFSFEIILPRISETATPNQTANTVRTSVTGAVGATSIALENCGANAQVLAAGDVFKFDNHTKVYMATAPVVASALGTATLFFTSPLLSAVPSGTDLTIDNVPFTAILEDDAQQFSVGLGNIYNGMSFNMREVF